MANISHTFGAPVSKIGINTYCHTCGKCVEDRTNSFCNGCLIKSYGSFHPSDFDSDGTTSLNKPRGTDGSIMGDTAVVAIDPSRGVDATGACMATKNADGTVTVDDVKKICTDDEVPMQYISFLNALRAQASWFPVALRAQVSWHPVKPDGCSGLLNEPDYQVWPCCTEKTLNPTVVDFLSNGSQINIAMMRLKALLRQADAKQEELDWVIDSLKRMYDDPYPEETAFVNAVSVGRKGAQVPAVHSMRNSINKD